MQTSPASVDLKSLAQETPYRERSGWSLFWFRLQSSRMALPATGVVIILILAGLFAPLIAPYDPIEQFVDAVLRAPYLTHPLGTDAIGRDILSRIIFGARASLQVGITAVCIAAGIGVPLGLVSGYRGGVLELIIMRIMDSLQAFPPLVLALSLTAVLGPNLTNATIAIAIVYSPLYYRLVRGQTLSTKEREFVEAARTIGLSDMWIAFRHILPNVASPVIVQSALSMSFAILTEASISFLGLGQRPPAPSWGSMLRSGYSYLEIAPWLSIIPGIAILITVLSFNFLGDAIRDALDPRQKA